ncbi:AprI/Inh family metalloprotease inhibitor [Candidatus Liberibacter brunswickensis]|uniref:AprI/Inh family metalloprotease inhibitor n=1 Tax=Candidatus Liberibacter brunswickensis TaxID=1968796 RepID=UPI002FDF5B3C
MQSSFFVFIAFFIILLSSGCKSVNFTDFFERKSNFDDSPTSIESENLPAPIPEKEFDDDYIPVPSKDNAFIRKGIIGAWKISYKNFDCNMILTLTRFKKDFRATPIGCSSKFAYLSAWNIIDENSLELKNRYGRSIIVLNKNGDYSFEGSFFKGKSSDKSISYESEKVIISRGN